MKPADLTKENVIARTLYGSDVYSHILRQYYPADFLMKVSGDDCGWNRNPWDNSRPSLHIWMEKIYPEAKLPRRIARHHDSSGHIPDGNFLDFAERFYHKTGDELLQIISDELYLNLGKQENQGLLFQTPFIEQPHFSFFKAPVSNTVPHKQITVRDAYNYIVGRYARTRTQDLRKLRDVRRARQFKATQFDYCTFSGTFSVRKEDKLIQHSGLLCLDFDHLPDVEGLFRKLQGDEYFETQLLFRSPSGDGLKWVIPVDLTECGHGDYFRSVSAYIHKTYSVQVDPSGKDVCRACFLPCDPQAYINPELL